ncbi:retention module-containing protein [Citrobacter werkmanii]|uniref:retention module-containing protein n=1 Tax=Citrobacter werkmanii TaxID=67827 RepID=UPI001901DD72|nr:retention module-containing protein [Citrobacter werkmanii]MBJ9296770.1 retention module-containing protein [Citrobacter werkmanii]
MSKLLGVIKAIIGQVYVVDASGTQRLVHEGDRVYSGEEIVTGVSGAVSLSLPDGKTLDIGRNSHWGEHGLQVSHNPEHDAQNIAAVQKAIADGADPTQVLEATAAGNDAPVQLEGGGGGHTLVQLELTGQVVDPTAGFNTKGLGSPNWDINLPVGGEGAGSASVFPPEVQITEFAGNDGFINKSEFHQTHLSGTSNQNHVTLTFTDSQKNTFTVEVPVNSGHWNINTDLGGLVPGNVTVVAIATDVTGRTAESVDHALIDITGPDINISVESVTPDNLINYAESRQPQTMIHGSVGGDAKPGDIVTLLVDGKEYTGVVTDPGNGALIYTIPVQTQGLLNDPNIHATLTSFDDAGNRTTVSTDHHVDTDLSAQNAVTIEVVANDDVVNANEFRMPTVISGVASGDAKAGDPVTLTLQGKEFHGTVFDDHGQLRYEIVVPSATLKEGANEVQVTLVSHDDVGNKAIAVTHRTVVLDTQAHNALTIDTVTDDNTLNRAELFARNQVISGTVGGEDAKAGDPVQLELNGHQYNGQVIDLGNNTLGYRIAVNASDFANNSTPVDGNVEIKVMVTSHDASGNLAITTGTHSVHIDNHAANQVSIDAVATDDVVNAIENRMTTLISGVAGGDARVGDAVTVNVQGQNFSGTVTDDNGQLRYVVALPTGVLLEGKNDVVVTLVSHDAAGNEATALAHRSITLDTQAHNSLTINDVDGDNTLNRSELYTRNQVISGTIGSNEDAKPGDPVQLEINGHQYRGEVIDLGNNTLGYRIAVNTSDFADNSVPVNGNVDVTVMVTSHDASGNLAIATGTHSVHIDNVATNQVSIDTVAGDDVVNAVENATTTLISGEVGGDALVGDPVSVSVQGQTFAGTVVNDNGHLRYAVALPKGVLLEGNNDVVVTLVSHDAAGNEATALEHRAVVLDTHAYNALTINNVTADNTLNRSELYMRNQVITGRVNGEDASVGDPVELEINGHRYSGQVIELGKHTLGYRIAVDSSAFADNTGNVQGDVKVHAIVTSHDAAGNLAVASSIHSVHIDNYAENNVTINTVAGDNVINIKEFSENNGFTHITGTVTGADAKEGDEVTLQLKGGYSMTSTVIALAGGGLGYSFPVNTHMLMTHPEFNVTVTSTDDVGNTVTHSESKTIDVDMYTQSHITIDGVTADNVINIKESTENNGQTKISGSVSGDAKLHDTVELVIDNQRFHGYVETLANGNLGYHIWVDTQALIHHPVIQAYIHTTDNHGNEMTATAERTVGADLNASASINIDTVAGDDIISNAESQLHTTLISGPVGGDAKPGDKVTLTFNNQSYQGHVETLAGGSLGYRIWVSTDKLPDGSAQNVHVSISTVDDHGNPSTATHDRLVHIDLHAESTITIDPVTDDNVLNHSELDTPMQLISGIVGGDAQVGDVVTVEIGGHTFTDKVIELGGGKLGYQIPVDSTAFSDNKGNQDKNVTVKVTVISHDTVENGVITTATHDVHIDNHARASITVDTVAGDDKLNGAEAAKHLTEVMGTVSGDVHAGAKVQVIVNGHTYETTAQNLAEHNGALGYKLDVLSRDLVKDPHIVARVVGEDNVHNVYKAEVTHDLVVDLHAKAILTIDPVTNDNMINGDESHKPFTDITGRVGGDVHINDVVYLTVNGHVLTGKVGDIGGGVLGYSIKVSTADLIADPHLTATVSTTDGAGNPATANAQTTVIIDTRVDAQITIDTVTPDNTLNLAEQMHGYTLVSGTVNGEVHPGDPLVMTINGQTYSGTVEDLGGHKMGFHIPVATTDLVASPHIEVSMNVTDTAQNHAHIVANHSVNLDAQALASITIDPVTGDDVLNKSELGQATTTVSGTVGGDARINDVVHLNIGGHLIDATVTNLPNLGTLGYAINVDTQWLQNDPHITATITTTDTAGNYALANAHSTVVIDDKIDAIVNIDPIVTDDGDAVINHDEALNPQTTVTGTVGGDVKIGDTVELTINHQIYYAQVEDHNGQHVFSTRVSTLDLLMDPNIHAEVTAKDDAGNIARGYDDMPVQVDTVADAGITIDTASNGLPPGQTVANDLLPGHRPDFISVSGHVDPDAIEGDTITITVGQGVVYTTHVRTLADGTLGYQANIGTGDLDDDGNILVAITTHDNHGNTATATEHKFIDLPWLHHTAVIGNTPYGFTTPPVVTPPTTGAGTAQPHQPTVHLTVDKVAGDDVLNHDEAQKATTVIRGLVTGDVQVGDDVIVTINNVPYIGHVKAIPTMPGQLAYEVDVPTTALQAHPSFDVSVTVKNTAGTATDSAQKNITVDTENPLQVTMHKIAGDDVINGKEAQAGKVTVSGTVSGEGIHDGSVVNLLVNGNTLTTVVHLQHGQWVWSKDVSVNDLHNTPDIEATVAATDDHGNVGKESAKSHVVVDLSADAGVTIDKIAQDNVLNAQESLQPKMTVTGSLSGDVHPGDKVTLTVNGNPYAATVDKNHCYSVDIYTKDLLADRAIVATVLGYDDHGNVQPASFTQGYSIDTSASGSVTINTVGGDDIINADEVKAGSVEVSGTVDGDVHLGDKVTILVDGVTVHTRVIELPHMNGQLGYKAMVSTVGLQNDPTIHVSVQGHDAAGNPMHAVNDKTITIDTQVDASIVLDKVSVDDVLNNEETQHAKTTISGYVTGDVDVGDQVTITVNGKDLVAEVKNSGGHKVFSVEASTIDLIHDQQITARVTAHDDAGNRGEIHTDKTITIDRTAVGTMDIDNVTQDNVLNYQELQGAIVRVTGHLGGDVDVWDSIKLKIGGQEIIGSVDTLGNGERVYHVDVDSDLMKANTTFSVEVQGHDAPGNPFSKTLSHNYSVDDRADATLSVDKVAGDNHISRAESLHATTHITGSVTGDMVDGDHIKALVNGKQYDATIHQIHNELRYDIEVETSSFHAGHNRVNLLVEAHDDHGNITPYTQTLNVTMDDPARHKGHMADKGNHAAMQHALHNLFDDSALSLSYAPVATGHGHGHGAAVLSAGEKAKAVLDKVDLSDLARELHEGVDIAKYIQSGGDHHQIASPAKVAHGIDTALSTHASGDLHSATYSLDHLIARPDHNSTH